MPNTDYLEVELRISEGNAEVVIGKSKQLLKDFVAEAEKAQPNIRFKIDGASYIDLDKLEKKAAETRNAFADITKVRLDKGQLGFLTKEIVVTSERARQLQSDISSIKRELANPARTSSIKFLTQELQAAEREADALNRKLSTVGGQNAPSGSKGGAEQVSNKLGRLRGFGAIFRAAGLPELGINESEINAALAGIDLFNEHYAKTAAVAASTSKAVSAASAVEVAAVGAVTAARTAEGAAATEAAAAEVAASTSFAGITGAAIAAFAAGAAVVGAVAAAAYHVTKDIRDEAERRLKVEEDISATINKQLLAARDLTREFNLQRGNAATDRDFTKSVQGKSTEELQAQQANLENLIRLLPKTGFTPNAKEPNKDDSSVYFANLLANYRKQDLELDKLIADSKEKTKKNLDDAYAQNAENYRKSSEQAAKYDNDKIEKQNAAAKKRLEDLEKAQTKINELGKKATETFDNLFVSTSKDNPFASIFSESDRAVDRLRENLKGLSLELRSIAEQLQKTNDSNKLFDARIDNSLSVFALRDEANNFRNPRTDSLVDKNRFDEIVRQNISQGNFFNGNFGSFGSDLANKSGGFDKLTDAQKRDIFEVATFSNLKNNPVNSQAGYSGFGANPTDFVGFLARQRSNSIDYPNATLQERLQKQIDIVGSSDPKTDDEKSIADKKLIALTAGLDPAKSTDRINDIAASAREREAVRREGSEKDAEKDRKKQIELQTRIAENQEKLLKIAEKEGLKGLDKLLVEVKDSPTTKSTVTRANPSDTAKQMDLSGTYFEQSRRK